MERGIEKDDSNEQPLQNSKINPSYKEGELIVIYDDDFPKEECHCVRKAIEKTVKDVYCKKTKNNGKLELWKTNNIHSQIHIERVVRSLGSSSTHSEKVKFSFNYQNGLPYDVFDSIDPLNLEFENIHSKPDNENQVIIAVLDTGVDFDLIPEEYLWRTNIQDQNSGKLIFGKNFVKDDNDDNDYDVSEDNPSLHGTLINGYIIEQFKNSRNNSVKIMNLKTHDENGIGDLFSTISAIQFAMDHGAHIINASWGFYIDEEMDNNYLQKLKLFKEGVFFITAAGNKIEQADLRFNELKNKNGSLLLNPRNISHHFFYPAYFSKGLSLDENNIITVTTIDKIKDCVSPTQNFSPEIVDLGVQADLVNSDPEYFLFNFPFRFKNTTSQSLHISGSSFAAAIASGKIGANLPMGKTGTKINKIELINYLDEMIFTKGDGKLKDQIKEGRYILKRDPDLKTDEYKINF